ncbi:hypothetical protein GobsT_18120 [Gemmata obscuriglobus]|nr:DUF6878 family protein [Gemmata obscuriglobus]QEG27059.1 hypothetical protein GobsT_18120 [Gemmata obscuriglobus]VTS03470.1 Uncharacterized protein OS=Erythrobacter litoralis (strain HTCC2594) GN=ELI_00680 PE=4 SV=1 [Gemmata obscuriglobus UQM 2246]
MTKHEILALLQQSAVSRLEISYDSSDDEGMIDSVTCFGPDGAQVKPTPEINSLVEELVCEMLDEQQGGWELDDGSFGEVEIDVETGLASFSHTVRVIDYSDEDFVVSILEGN